MSLNIALTGGIGAGKSTVAKELASLGAYIIDADVLARKVVEPGTAALSLIAENFGPQVLTATGELDRPKLADLVFSSESQRELLNGIVHPAIREESTRLKTTIRADNPQAVIVEDIPLLAESGQAATYHGVIVVTATIEHRLQRLKQRGLSVAQAHQRIEAQATEAQRHVIADWVVDNNGSIQTLKEQVQTLWWSCIIPYRDALVEGGSQTSLRDDVDDGALIRACARIRAAFETFHFTSFTVEATNPIRLGLGSNEIDLEKVLFLAGFVAHPAGGFVSGDPCLALGLQVV